MRARTCALRIVAAIGAHPLWMGAAAHDASIAATSHLPYLLASALTLATPADAAPLIGPGFLSAGRLAATPSSMMLGVLQSNGRNVLSALSRFRHSLDDLETAIIENDMNMLRSLLDQAASRLEELTR
jgi:prephenate dehydrogenase